MWLTPREALDRHERGELAMLPPTVITLTELSQYATVAEVLAAAAERDISPVLPRIVLTGDSGEQMELLLPHEEGCRRVHDRPAHGRSASASVLLAPNPSPMTLEGTNTWLLRGAAAADTDGYVVDRRRAR